MPDTSSGADAQVAATVRLSVAGPVARVDLAVPVWADADTVLARYLDETGTADAGPLVLRTSDGRVLEPERPLAALGLEHGDLLHVGPAEPAPALADAPARSARPAVPAARSARTATRAALAGVAAVAAAGLSVTLTSELRLAAGALLLLCALLGLGRLPREPLAWSAVLPAFGLGAGYALGHASGPGGLFLGLAVAGLGALAVAAAARAVVPVGEEEVLDVWLAASAALALSSLLALVTGAAAAGLLAGLIALAVMAALLLPALVVDVPDTVLVDLDRLAVTAWSPRERARGGRKRAVVRPEAVAGVVRRAQRLVTAGSVAVAVVVAVAGPVLSLTAPHGLTGDGARVLVLLGAAVLTLAARGVRSRVPRSGFRAAAALCFLALGAEVALRLADLGEGWWWLLPAVAALLGVLVALTAVAVGRGWRSVWWARLADVAQSLCLVLMVAAVPVATGLFAWVRQFAS